MYKLLVRTIAVVTFCSLLLPFKSMAAEGTVLVRTSKVLKQTVSQTLNVFGTIQPDTDKIFGVSMAHAGIISLVNCRLGQVVKKGDLLMETTTAPVARMNYQQAKAQIDYAKKDLARKKQLLAQQLATNTDVANAEKALRDAQAAMAAEQAQGTSATLTQIHAPIDGIITTLNVTQGQRVQADATALLITPRNQLVARLGIEPEDIDSVKVGMRAEIKSVFSKGKTVTGTVREIHAMINPQTRLVDVNVVIPSDDAKHFIPGMQIKGKIILSQDEALTVPRNAVLTDSGGSYIFLVSNDKAVKRYIKVDYEQAQTTAISGNIQANDSVVISGNYELEDGQVIREQAK